MARSKPPVLRLRCKRAAALAYVKDFIEKPKANGIVGAHSMTPDQTSCRLLRNLGSSLAAAPIRGTGIALASLGGSLGGLARCGLARCGLARCGLARWHRQAVPPGGIGWLCRQEA
jgi:hypothetical protein